MFLHVLPHHVWEICVGSKRQSKLRRCPISMLPHRLWKKCVGRKHKNNQSAPHLENLSPRVSADKSSRTLISRWPQAAYDGGDSWLQSIKCSAGPGCPGAICRVHIKHNMQKHTSLKPFTSFPAGQLFELH